MQYLIDFIHENSLEQQLYVVLPAGEADLELFWRRLDDPEHWQARRTPSYQPAERVSRQELLDYLLECGADLRMFERELRLSAAVQIVAAQQLLTEAERVLGSDIVGEVLEGHQRFTRELLSVVARLSAPKLEVLRGEGEQTGARSGHLALVR